MAQNGMFRNAMGGFNKQDVLQYIDGITAEWNVEREDLNRQVNEAADTIKRLQEQMDALIQQAQESTDRIREAEMKAQVSDTQLAEVQQQLFDATADLAAQQTANEQLQSELAEAQARINHLEQTVSDVTRQRDDAIAAVADAKGQLGTVTELEQKLADSHAAIAHKDEQMEGLQQAISRYEKIMGNVEDAHERVDSIVRPFIDQANKQADETLDSVQAVLAALLAQLGEIQGNVEQRRMALQRCKADSESRLTAAFGDWLEEAKQATPTHHFFR